MLPRVARENYVLDKVIQYGDIEDWNEDINRFVDNKAAKKIGIEYEI